LIFLAGKTKKKDTTTDQKYFPIINTRQKLINIKLIVMSVNQM